MDPFRSLDIEAQWLMNEYERCFGKRIEILQGSPNHIVNGMQAAVIRFYVEKIKEIIERGK